MSDLFGEMTDEKFTKLATSAIVNWWNNQDDLVSIFGSISSDDVYTTWKCKAIENFKGLFGVSRDGDGLYFEFTFHGNKSRCYLDVYKKQTQSIIDLN